MKILIVSGFFYPTNTPRAFRTTELAKELFRQGHSVTVCVPKINYDYSKFLEEYPFVLDFLNISSAARKKAPGNRWAVLWYRLKNRLESTYLQYPTIKYYWEIPQYLASKREKFDAIISIAVPHPIHWGVAKAKRKLGNVSKVWIADCGDPFMLCKTDSFRKPFYFKWFEKDFCSRADYITVPVEGGKTGYYPEFRSKIRVIPQGFDFSEIKIVEYRQNAVVTFAYAGGFIPEIRDPRPILDYLCESNRDFRFYIYTKQDALIASYKERLGNKLVVSDYIDRTELIYRMSSYDFLLNIENGTSVQTPSKLIDYALAKRPVLSLNSQNVDRAKFERFINRDYSQQMELPDVENYNIINVAKTFVDLMEEKIAEKATMR